MSDVHCPARIIVARHGEAEYERPEMNASGGSLTSLGREQARELGERLRSERVAGVVCSELSRAVQTAEIAARCSGCRYGCASGCRSSRPATTSAATVDPVFSPRWLGSWL